MKTEEPSDFRFIQRCIQLAKNALGNTYPNPLVGSVIVHDGKIIGEGWHHKAGEAHAEVNAIRSVKNKTLLKESTLYVNLEPCSHFGKTPPCSDLIIANKIPRVVIGCQDPFEKVNGSGIQKLKEAGIEVLVNVGEVESQELNSRFFTYHQKKRPYILLKWAQSQDGYIAPEKEIRTEKKAVFLSSKEDQIRVHQWRKEEEAILIGVQTLIDDNPSLTTRWVDGKNPIRIVLDPNNRAKKNANVFTDNNASTLHFTRKSLGLKKECSASDFLNASLNVLFEQKISSVLVEGGSATLQHFIDQNIWDEARIFVAEKKLVRGVKAPEISKQIVQYSIGYTHLKNKASK